MSAKTETTDSLSTGYNLKTPFTPWLFEGYGGINQTAPAFAAIPVNSLKASISLFSTGPPTVNR